MAELAKKKENPHKSAAIQLFAFNHGITIQEVASKLNVSHRLIRHWREEPEFHLEIYNCYMSEFDSKLPSVSVASEPKSLHNAVSFVAVSNPFGLCLFASSKFLCSFIAIYIYFNNHSYKNSNRCSKNCHYKF